MLTGCTLAALLLALPAKEKPKLPTTKEEFAALAKENPLPPWLPFRNGRQVGEEWVRGVVVGTTDDSITVRPDGMKQEVRYPAHVLLATGAVCHWESESHSYLLPDVQKGDEVLIGVGTVDKGVGDECFYISIRKRPGGTIPPSRKPSTSKPYHEEQQKRVDGVPEPIKRDPPPEPKK